MKQDRFLVGILVGIAFLVLVALVMFFVRKDRMDYVSDQNPDGAVHNYVIALYKHDYQKAYGYLADLEYKPDYEKFRQDMFMNQSGAQNIGVDIGSVEMISDTEAIVMISLIYNNSDPFSSGYRNEDKAYLVKQNGSWKIRQLSYNFWSYDWYMTPPAPVK